MVRVLASNSKLLLRFGVSFTQQRRAGAPQTTDFWNQVPEWNLWKLQPSLQLSGKQKACESSDYANANANASASQCIHDDHYQTWIKQSKVHPKQVEYDDSLVKQSQVFVA